MMLEMWKLIWYRIQEIQGWMVSELLLSFKLGCLVWQKLVIANLESWWDQTQMEDVEAVQHNLTAQTGGRNCLRGSTVTASSKKRRPGQMLRAFAMAKVVTWLLSPTQRSTTTSTERMHKSGWEGQIKVVKETGDGRIAVPGGVSPCGVLLTSLHQEINNPTME